MLRIRSTSAVLAGLMPALAFGAALGPAAPRTAATMPGRPAFQLRVRRHFGPAGNASGYSVIVAAGKRSAWVFGGTNPGGLSAPVADRWNGRTLTPSGLPARLTGFISDASAPSAQDVWAVSAYGSYALHWNGRSWRVARRWQRGNITGVTAVNDHEVWVFGTTAAGFTGTGTWYYNGTSWRKVRGRASAIFRASAVSSRDVWAIGARGRADFILHFNGSRWRQVRAGRAFNHLRLADILALSSRNVWVIGNAASRSGATSLVLEHWNGRSWRTVLTRAHVLAGRLARGRHATVLLTATPTGLSATGLVIQVSSGGLLSATTIRSAQGSGVSDVALPAAAQGVWASGGVLTRLGGDAAVWVGPVARPAYQRDLDRPQLQ